MLSVAYAPSAQPSAWTYKECQEGEQESRGGDRTQRRGLRARLIFLKLSSTRIMTGLRAIATRSRSKAPAPPPEAASKRRQSGRKTVVSDDEDEDEDEEEDEDLEELSREELMSRLKKAKGQRTHVSSLSPEEQDELDEDPFADQSDHEDEDHHGLRAQKRRLGASCYSQRLAKLIWPSLDPIEEEEEMEEDAVERIRASKRARVDPKFTSSDGTPVASNVSRSRRKSASSASQQAPAAATAAAEKDATSAQNIATTTTSNTTTGARTTTTNNGRAPGEPTTPRTSSASLPYTPFKPAHNGKKAREADASPSTKSLLKGSCLVFRVGMAVSEAWPGEARTASETQAAFNTTCDDVGAATRKIRYQKDHVYAKYIGDVCEQRRSQLRGEVKSKAQVLVASAYKLEGGPVAIAEQVKDLLARKNYTFKNPEKRQGMYGHSIFELIIYRQWFIRADSEGCGRYSKEFNPIPLPLIALVATAVHCALTDWESGTCQPSRNKFEYDIYEPIYRDHMASLSNWQRNNMARCAARQQGLWTRVWQLTGRQPPSINKVDDFDEADYNRASDDEA
ncbi:hypothetical protein EIP86_010306 [Pleurotus ostreatoroseus]|nr:hypothetical protein EIP86_010306 [Pleurotus ostreatoroseus]